MTNADAIPAALWLLDQIEETGGHGATVVRGGKNYDVLLDVTGSWCDTYYINLEQVLEDEDGDEHYQVLDSWGFELDDAYVVLEIVQTYVAAGGNLSDFSGSSFF